MPDMIYWTGGIIIVIFAVIVFGIAVAMRLVGRFLGGYCPDADKETPFEGGVPPTGDARVPFSVNFYLVAVSFLIFELEAAFLFAWAVAYWEVGVNGTIGALLFIDGVRIRTIDLVVAEGSITLPVSRCLC